MTTRSTMIEAGLNADGNTEFKVGEKVVLTGCPADDYPEALLLEPADITKAIRVAYRKGRDDATAENRAVLRGLVGI